MRTMEKNQTKRDRRFVGRSEFANRDSEVRPMEYILFPEGSFESILCFVERIAWDCD